MMIHDDCRFFLGHKPCRFRRACDGCPHYSPFGKRILIIKLAALGDVLRTTPLLRGLREKNPICHITWLTEPGVVPMLRGIPEIDRLISYDPEAVLQLSRESFDHLYCFDKEPKASALAMSIEAPHKSGFGMTRFGNVMPLSPESEYMFRLGIDDELKFRARESGIQAKLRELERQAIIAREQAVERLLRMRPSSSQDEAIHLFYTREEGEEIY